MTRALALCLALAVLPACGGLVQPARTAASVLSGTATVLRSLADADGADGLLDLALGQLEVGDLVGCCSTLRRHLLEYGDDPRVRAVLTLLQGELRG